MPKSDFEPMPDRYLPLAVYNDEISRGLLHTPEYKLHMSDLQSEFNAWQSAQVKRSHLYMVPNKEESSDTVPNKEESSE